MAERNASQWLSIGKQLAYRYAQTNEEVINERYVIDQPPLVVSLGEPCLAHSFFAALHNATYVMATKQSLPYTALKVGHYRIYADRTLLQTAPRFVFVLTHVTPSLYRLCQNISRHKPFHIIAWTSEITATNMDCIGIATPTYNGVACAKGEPIVAWPREDKQLASYTGIFGLSQYEHDEAERLLKKLNLGTGTVRTNETFAYWGAKWAELHQLPLSDERIAADLQVGERVYSFSAPLCASYDDVEVVASAVPCETKRSIAAVEQWPAQLASAVSLLAERIEARLSLSKLVLVSLLPDGAPAGIWLRRYYKQFYHLDVPHFSIGYSAEAGLDVEALHYIRRKYPTANIQFVACWSGKGDVLSGVARSCQRLNEAFALQLDGLLAVIADDGDCATLYGTKDDWLFPHVFHSPWQTKNERIGRSFYFATYEANDDWVQYVDEVSEQLQPKDELGWRQLPTWKGWETVRQLKTKYQLSSYNDIVCGYNETVQALATGEIDTIIVRERDERFAEQTVIVDATIHYACCGLKRGGINNG